MVLVLIVLHNLISAQSRHLTSHFLGHLCAESLEQRSSYSRLLAILFPAILPHYPILSLAVLRQITALGKGLLLSNNSLISFMDCG